MLSSLVITGLEEQSAEYSLYHFVSGRLVPHNIRVEVWLILNLDQLLANEGSFLNGYYSGTVLDRGKGDHYNRQTNVTLSFLWQVLISLL